MNVAERHHCSAIKETWIFQGDNEKWSHGSGTIAVSKGKRKPITQQNRILFS